MSRLSPLFACLLLWTPAVAGTVAAPADGHVYTPAWSVQGDRIAFELNRQQSDIDLYIAEVDGDVAKPPTKVNLPGSCSFGTCDQVVINPTWHKEGSAIFEATNSGGQLRLYFASSNGASASQMLDVAAAPGNLSFPNPSPDGDLLAFVSSETGAGDIYLYERQDGSVRQLTASPGTESFPQISADSARVLFSRQQGPSQDIYELTIGGAERLVAGGEGDQTRPTYAGERMLFFSSLGPSGWELQSVTGEVRSTLASGVRLPLRARPAVSSDGRHVAYTYDDPTKNMFVEVARTDGTGVVQIRTPYVACSDPALTVRDGRTILAYTALPEGDAGWRFLVVQDITGAL